MLANIGKSVVLDFIVSICSSTLAAIVALLFSKLLDLEQVFDLIIFIAC